MTAASSRGPSGARRSNSPALDAFHQIEQALRDGAADDDVRRADARLRDDAARRRWSPPAANPDPEWKYVNLRRYLLYLEHSIDRSTQWAVFEPDGDELWAKVRSSVEDLLCEEWRAGALLGDRPEDAYFVRCDRSTMTQNDLDNGRLVCVVGVAVLRPAELVIFRIGQWTADAQPVPPPAPNTASRTSGTAESSCE